MANAEITALLRADDPEAFDRAVALVYQDLRRLARRQRRGSGPGPATLNTTALVHEAFLKVAGHEGDDWESRGHFLAVAARAMRCVLVDYARARRRHKRGGDAVKVELEEGHGVLEKEVEEMLALDEALGRLAAEDPRAVRVVECRYFAGMTAEETATAAGVSVATVERDWSRARQRLKVLLMDS